MKGSRKRFELQNNNVCRLQRQRIQASPDVGLDVNPAPTGINPTPAGENPAPTGINSGPTEVNAVPSYGNQEVTDGASLKFKIDYLEKFTAKQTEQISVLTKVVQEYQTKEAHPKCCKIPYVKKMMTDVACKLLVGHYSFSSLYPSEDIIIECLLASFQVHADDKSTRSAFMEEWTICKKEKKV